jgi:cytochrome P450
MSTTFQTGTAIPDEIARAVVLAESHVDPDIFYPAYKWLRENMPLGRASIDGFDDLWLVSKHADILEVERQPDLFHNADLNPILNDRANDDFAKSINNGSTRALDVLTYMDPPEHGQIRQLTSQWFMPANVRKFEDEIRRLARASVARLLDFDGECDFVKDFALHYPLRVILTLFGLGSEHEPRMLKLTQEFFGTQDPEEQRDEVALEPDAAARQWAATIQDFYDYFEDLAADRREHPRDDLLSLIANSKIDGKYLPYSFQNGYYVAIATAGHDTTSSTIAGAAQAFTQFPEQLEKVRNDLSLVGGLVDESLRWTSPVKHFMRNATADTVLRGQEIKKLDRLMLMFPSANRDEDVFTNPDEFDVTRRPNKHVAFGYGPHMCLGMHIAKLEMRLLWTELLPHLKSIELAGEPKLMQTNFVGGLKSLPVRFTKV